MKFLQTVRSRSKLTNYALSKKLKELGVDVTVSGLDAYERKNAQSMRFDVLAACRKVAGMSWSELGKEIDDEFLAGENNGKQKK